jgi:ParB-like chromosome segregation protein Spo0J
VVAALWEQVLVRLDKDFPLTDEQIQESLRFSPRTGERPEVPLESIREAGEVLISRGLASHDEDGWRLTLEGHRDWIRREDHFENSGQRGDYGW